MKQKLLALTLAGSLALLCAGCMEQAKEDLSSTVSRLESGAEDLGSRLESEGSRAASALESAVPSQEESSPKPQPR